MILMPSKVMATINYSKLNDTQYKRAKTMLNLDEGMKECVLSNL